ncbi:MAG: PAS domain S-box protein [Hyphomicrobiaceae bacterium]
MPATARDDGAKATEGSTATTGARTVDCELRGVKRPGFGNDVEHRFLEASPDCIKIIDSDGRIAFMNENGRCLLELDAVDNVIERPWVDLWPESERHIVVAGMREAQSGRTARFSAFCPTARGTPKWWDVVVSPVAAGPYGKASLLAVSRDVTHQKSIEQTLRTSEQHFRALANHIAQLAWMADSTGAIFWYNQRWFDFTGTSFAEMAGWGWKSVHHPDHLDRVVEKFTDCIVNGEEWEDVFPLRGADGEYRWFLSRARPIRDAAGNIELWCGTNTDVTDQRTQSQRLRQLVRIIDLSHEAILVWDFDNGILIWNRGCEELYGYEKSVALGSNSHALLKTRHPMPREDFERLLLAQGSWSGELLHIASDGSEVWVDSRHEVIRVGGNRLVLETNRDITDRRRADEIRNLLVAELNHRVKNTMAIIQSIATQTARTAPTVDRFVSSFNGRLQSLASAHNVLTDSYWTGASIKALIQSQLAVVGGHEDRIDISGDDVFLPAQTALQFTLILHELATNAVKHGSLSTDSGRIAINWSVLGGEPSHIELTWRESGGPAVSPPARRGFGLNLIERSSRLPNLRTSTSFDPGGITVTLNAELRPDDSKGGDAQLFNPGKQLMKPRALETPSRSSFTRQRIMIVEREPRDAMLMEDVLYDAGYLTIGPVSSLADVERKLGLLTCDLAIVDIDGARADVASVLAALERHGVPTILIGSVRRLAAATDIGASVEQLAKPLQPQSLLAAIARQIAADRR